MNRSLWSTIVVSAAVALALGGCRKGPDGPPPAGSGGPGGPPPEAISACQGKSAGESCQVKMGDSQMDGICAAGPAGASENQISCRPAHPGGPGGQKPAKAE
jgi:hypothetical protein